ncbi:MAG: type II CAAX prenyl endopeptidase Rce1 family protein [Candidatus Thorarchaeota archaeon]
MIQRKYGFTTKDKALYLLLFFIPFSLYVSIILYSNSSLSFFIPFDRFVGMKLNHNFFLFLIYVSIIGLKLLGIKIYFSRNKNILEVGQGDEIFQFFTRNIDYKKVILLVILFPLSAYIEELIYRSLLISVFTYYLNFNYILTIIIISIIFGLVHYSTSHNWGHVISTLISSIVYSLALIQLGILYPWLFHLSTNLFVLLFYYQARKKDLMIH